MNLRTAATRAQRSTPNVIWGRVLGAWGTLGRWRCGFDTSSCLGPQRHGGGELAASPPTCLGVGGRRGSHDCALGVRVSRYLEYRRRATKNRRAPARVVDGVRRSRRRGGNRGGGTRACCAPGAAARESTMISAHRRRCERWMAGGCSTSRPTQRRRRTPGGPTSARGPFSAVPASGARATRPHRRTFRSPSGLSGPLSRAGNDDVLDAGYVVQ